MADHTGKFGYLTGEIPLPYKTISERSIYRLERIIEIDRACLHDVEYYSIILANNRTIYEENMCLLEDELKEIDQCLQFGQISV
jgi:hypothetical protein